MKKVAELKETSTLSMLSVDMENKESGSLDVKNSVENGRPPDPADWAVTDVVNYFRTAGFEEQASAFQEQVLRSLSSGTQLWQHKGIPSCADIGCCHRLSCVKLHQELMLSQDFPPYLCTHLRAGLGRHAYNVALFPTSLAMHTCKGKVTVCL
uniref:Uncharacterized protein n=2 Tax=Gopherus TaxID=38771 RepID=A0A452IXH9_9SAUR